LLAEKHTSQNNFYLSIFKQRALAHKANQCFPLRRAYLFTFMQKKLFFLSLDPLLKGHQLGGTMVMLCFGLANTRVCYMNGSMIEHDGLGIAFFSIDILKDMVAC
jgi:hypothetical protein